MTTTTTPSPVTELIAFTIDTPDAGRLARFYADLTGGEVTFEDTTYGYAQAALLGATFNFQTVADYSRPEWPGQEHPQQFHLDFRVGDLATARAHAEGLGAHLAPGQADGDGGAGWLVMVDPDGHPFCLCPPPAAESQDG
ncbi:VOC family protein [Pimelobacter simplex]|uniref:VOC family protein n=1 Tax=Nocardioides simplex TaxID=2045 RepID=UPI003AAECBB5